MFTADHLWLIPAIPLAAAAIAALTPRRGRLIASGLAIGSMTAALALSILALITALQAPDIKETFNFDWLPVGDGNLSLGFLLDPLTAFMLVMVTFVGLMIFIFSIGYMKDDPNFTRFFCFLALFASAMLGLIVANSLFLLFVCWELVGLASYLLIGFWFHKPSAAAAAKKAFLTTRIGDLGLLLGLLWLQNTTGTLLLYDSGNGILEATALGNLSVILPCGLALSTAIGLLIFCGAIGKSGQFPLHVWLPDAMEGPTPVSALIHAATMVAAGVFLIARVFPLMELDQAAVAVGTILWENNVCEPLYAFSSVHALTIVAIIGSITALLGAILAVAQNDIKRILAYSTVSQLGYMMLALGVGSWTAAIFHLLTHAFFKALLFLGAGSVIHAAHHEQDIRKLGGIGTRMKITFATFAVGMMALAGVPFVFSGFWSKESILHAAHAWDVSHLPFYIGLTAVVLTAFYMTRLICEVFTGKPRTESAEHARENSPVMTLPLIALAICAIALSFVGTPAWPWLQATLEGEIPQGGSLVESPALLLTSIVLVALGIGAGIALYGVRKRQTAGQRDPLERAGQPIFTALQNRLYFDELYAATLGKLNTFAANLCDFADRHIIGGAVTLFAKISLCAGLTQRETDEKVINAGFDQTSGEIRQAAVLYSKKQSGEPQSYLRAITAGFVILTLIVILGIN